jgi:PAS domain S-box-containing protein
VVSGEAKALKDFLAGSGHEANRLFGEMIEALPVAIYTTDAQGRLSYFNAAAEKLSGRVPEIGTDQWCVTWKLFLPDGTPLPHDQCPMAIALKGGEVPVGIECIAERPDGTRFWFTPYPMILRDREGRITGGMNLLVDITDRKHAQTEAVEASEQYRAIVETTPECVKIVGPDGTLIFMNSRGLEMIGAPSPDAVTGKDVYSLIAPEDRDRYRAFNEKICSGEKGSLEFSVIGLQGARRQMESHAAPLRYVDGAMVHVALTRDVTERKRMDEDLRESEERFRRVFEEGPLGLALIGKDYRYLKVNSALCRMVGYDEAELLRMSFVDITHPDDVQADVELAQQLFRREIPFYRMEKRYLKKTGEIIWINLTASMIRGPNGEPLHGMAMIEDITEIKRAQEEASFRQKLESVGTLAGGIAHDFNNLLGAVQAHAELALGELDAGSSCKEELKAICEVATRASEIVRQLMIYAGMENDVVGPVDLSKTVDEMLALLKVSVTKHAMIKADLDHNLPAIHASSAQIRQIVLNLITNSSDAIGDREGVIHVVTRRVTLKRESAALPSGTLAQGDYVQLQVSDTGRGIPPQTVAKVFDPFFTTKSAGRGLGLAVVQGIVRSLGGAISLTSESGQGTTFQILLPCTETTASVTGEAMSGAREPSIRAHGAVLIVEDEEHLRQAVAKMLRKTGFEVFEAADGSSAIDFLRIDGGKIDVIFLDMTLPGASSREVVAEAASTKPDIKVILTSAYSQEAITGAMSLPQIHSFIRKPFQLGDLLKTLQSSLPS